MKAWELGSLNNYERDEVSKKMSFRVLSVEASQQEEDYWHHEQEFLLTSPAELWWRIQLLKVSFPLVASRRCEYVAGVPGRSLDEMEEVQVGLEGDKMSTSLLLIGLATHKIMTNVCDRPDPSYRKDRKRKQRK